MHRTKAGSWILIAGMIALGGLLGGCGGGDSSGSSSASDNSTASGSSGASAAATSSSPSSAVTLSWQAPTENTDGTALTDLSGYTIHYGTQSQTYSQTIQVDNPGLTTYVVDNLAPGTYYFSVTATASDGTQSAYSPEVSAQVD
jgi:hypothetical protein